MCPGDHTARHVARRDKTIRAQEEAGSNASEADEGRGGLHGWGSSVQEGRHTPPARFGARWRECWGGGSISTSAARFFFFFSSQQLNADN